MRSEQTKGFSEDYQRALETAARRLLGGMSAVEGPMVRKQAEEEGDEFLSLPAHTNLYRIDDSCDERAIRRLLEDLGPPADDYEGILAFADEHGIDVDVQAYGGAPDCCDDGEMQYCEETREYVCSTCECVSEPDVDLDDLRQDVLDRWRDSGDEEAELASDGWQQVADTGILAREVCGALYLGIHGGGYSFYDDHWVPLYRALGYHWHLNELRALAQERAAREVARVAREHDEDDAGLLADPALVAAVRALQKAEASVSEEYEEAEEAEEAAA